MSNDSSGQRIMDCGNCPIDDWIHGCHLTAEECDIVLTILEKSIGREYDNPPIILSSMETKIEEVE